MAPRFGLIAGFRALVLLLALWSGLGTVQADTIEVGGVERDYRLDTPPGQGPWPLVVVFHGGNDRANRIRRRMGWPALGRQEGFAVVYPTGLFGGWNDGRDNMARYSDETPPEDLAFFDALLDRLIAEGIADPAHVYVTGPSNGGMMSLRIACDRAHRIAAAAPLIANMTEALYPVCVPSEPVPVMVINGTDDALIPWDGGAIAGNEERGRAMSAAATMLFWSEANGCDDAFAQERLPDLDPDDSSVIDRLDWQGCEAPVVLLRVEGGGHRVPGDRILFGEALVDALLGVQNNDIETAPYLWRFFEAASP